MHDYQQALEEYHETGDDAFYIRHQLAWLNQEYYKDHWVTYGACMAELMDFLHESEGRWMRKSEQNTFARQCTTLLMRFPILPRNLKRNSIKYKKDTSSFLGLKQLNNCLIEMDIPYRVVSRQRGSDHKTQWKLEHQ